MTDPGQIVSGWRPGLIGDIVGAHARYYATNWNFGVAFEGKVAADCAGFMARAGAEDLVLSAWDGNAFIGSLILDLNDPVVAPGEAHLRWFIVTKPGGGLGQKMMTTAMAHLDARRAPCFLTTFAGLDAARRLYDRHGFALIHAAEGATWGTAVTEQRFDRPAR